MVMTRAQKQARNDANQESEQEETILAVGLNSESNNLCDLVFGIDLLRETIIDFGLHSNKGGFSKQDALSCRLVNKSWLESVFKCLVKSGNSLVQLGHYGRSPESFLKIYVPSSRFPFKLKVCEYHRDFVRDLNFLKKTLNLCASGLVELELPFFLHFLQQKNKALHDFAQQKFNLPVLHKLTFSIDSYRSLSNTDMVNDNVHVTLVPQSVLSGCSRLRHFKFISFTAQSLPENLGNLLLPASVTNLVLDCNIGTNNLEALIKKNMHPKLTDLTLVMPRRCEGEKESFYEVLHSVRCTLKRLTILPGEGYGRLMKGAMVKVDIPVMKCLQKILIRTENFEWASGVLDLQEKLPVLTQAHLALVTSTSLTKWTQNSKFGCLTDVSIKFDGDDRLDGKFLTLAHAQLMSKAFSKVTNLEISCPIQGDVTSRALQCLFQNMNQLKILKITLEDNNDVHPGFLDGLLLGIPCKLIETLAAECGRGKLWEAVQLRRDKQHSLTNLSELRELFLNQDNFEEFSEYPTFVSEKVKKFVVSTMPNLQKIKLPLTIKEDPKLVRYWKQTGRIFNWGSSGPRHVQQNVQGAK